jgi:LPPG:FO 2-phospho-L-lactate transferase
MMAELGVEVSATAVARRYQDLLDGYVLDRVDVAEAAQLGIPVTAAHTLMTSLADREELARHVLASADALTKAPA